MSRTALSLAQVATAATLTLMVLLGMLLALLLTPGVARVADKWPGAVTSVIADKWPGAVSSVIADKWPGAVSSVVADKWPGAVSSALA